ncbi:uncharacterized protein AC631_00096 [Debaryomyces fabryi]|uniref:Zn(2)-C6 fungal-type domain-containing protein n=1 Tax=Debaryomyces fabryi TaxID=58627 RepID=A0A0V1Q6S4_9ASCO|nr:uncharacterized protein AC631_00096 [Debaryomyces fabryi]KSA04225.1 hypothetical protein AC631_00096 [Debaryomyces fabryi]CUM46285.1 unnamed protein product [Debaryomyces fabryi]
MSSNDLLSYSIMNKGHNVNSIPLLPLPIPLRPQGFTKIQNEKGHVVLPPLSDIKFNDYTPIRLTEGNLSNLNHSSPPSLTSSSASSSPVSSPSLSSMNLSGMNSPIALANQKSDSASMSASFISTPLTSTASESSESRKRRQRLGPSCDSCRTRKVKCDAEITILSKMASTANLQDFFPSHIAASLLENKQVEIEGSFNVIISNDKLIKFKSCKSCNAKNLPCCFTKGFTKEDIMLNNKKKPTSTSSSSGVSSSKSKVSKKKPNVSPVGSRKSSCSACRRRKIKCVFNDALNKCEGCAKKDHSCLFENIN